MNFGWFKRLIILLKPRYWSQLYGQSEEWDKELIELMKHHRFKPAYKLINGELNECYCTLGPWKVWYTNHPYSSYSCYGSSGSIIGHFNTRFGQKSPSRYTVYVANKKRKEDFKYYFERQTRVNKLHNGDYFTPKSFKTKQKLESWSD